MARPNHIKQPQDQIAIGGEDRTDAVTWRLASILAHSKETLTEELKQEALEIIHSGGFEPHWMSNGLIGQPYWNLEGMCARQGHFDLLKALNESPTFNQKIDVTLCSVDDYYLMHLAAIGGHLDIMQWLDGFSPFPVLVKQNAGATTDENDRGKTPLHFAAECGHADVVEWLLGEKEVPMNVKGERGMLPLHWAARNDHLDCVKVFEKHDSPLTEEGKQGGAMHQPIHFAAQFNAENVLRYLLFDKKMDPHVPTSVSDSLMYLACMTMADKSIYVLCEAGIDPNEPLVDGINTCDGVSYTPHVKGAVETLEALLKCGLNPNCLANTVGSNQRPLLAAIIESALENSHGFADRNNQYADFEHKIRLLLLTLLNNGAKLVPNDGFGVNLMNDLESLFPLHDSQTEEKRLLYDLKSAMQGHIDSGNHILDAHFREWRVDGENTFKLNDVLLAISIGRDRELVKHFQDNGLEGELFDMIISGPNWLKTHFQDVVARHVHEHDAPNRVVTDWSVEVLRDQGTAIGDQIVP